MGDKEEMVRRVFKSMNPTCTCGGPALGTDHAPDCEIERKWDDAVEIVEDHESEPGCFNCGATVAIYEDLCLECKPEDHADPIYAAGFAYASGYHD